MKRNLPQIKKLRHYSLFLIGLLGLSQTGWAQATQAFSANGTFTIPKGVTSVKVECLGAGGGGSNRGGSAGAAGGTASSIGGIITASYAGGDYTESYTKYFSHNNQLNKLYSYKNMKSLT